MAGMGDLHEAVDEAVEELRRRDAIRRMWKRDHTLWAPEPTEIENRLGWLDEPDEIQRSTDTLREFTGQARADGLRHVVWCGMGGSSLFPLVLTEAFGPTTGGCTLEVLDTSHPAPLLRVLEGDVEHTLFCFASKSGGTIETRSQLDLFWDRVARPDQFVVVTDEGSALDDLARERSFRARFHANPDIGGRYSALSHFGMVPAALLGLATDDVLGGARDMLDACRATDPAENPAAVLAAFIGGHARAGRWHCTLHTPPELGPFGAWLEQLVAESTGKHGVGILPVDGEPLGAPGVYRGTRTFVAYDEVGELRDTLQALRDAGQPVALLDRDGQSPLRRLGAEVVRWEIATALAGALLGINPFDQPDVEAAKKAAGAALAGDPPAHEPEDTPDLAGLVTATAETGSYVAIQAYLDPEDPRLATLERARVSLRDAARVTTTLGLGPRYLHSTGQLHKGGPAGALFVQVLDNDPPDLAVPGRAFSFAQLLRAQADGDRAALSARRARVLRVDADDLAAAAERLTGPGDPHQE